MSQINLRLSLYRYRDLVIDTVCRADGTGMTNLSKTVLRTLLVVLIGLQVGIFGQIARAESDSIRVMGSTTIQPLASSIGQAFTRQNPAVAVEVSGGGSAAGIRALIDGKVDIATSSSFISEAEISLAFQRGVYPVPIQIANDCILPIVHRSNPLAEISREDLRRIYTGELRNWNRLGGPDLEIEVVQRDGASGTFEVWQELVMNRHKAKPPLLVRDSNAAIVAAVANNPGAIGYISLSFLNAGIKPLAVDGIMGSRRSLRDGSYSLSRPLFLFTNGWPEGRTRQFVNFVLSPDKGQKMLADAQYIPLF